jgi:DNA-binding Lrp family transcriptional regulator
LDTLTRDIIRCMNNWHASKKDEWSVRPTYWAVAQRLGESPKAVKRRVDSMTKSGAMKRIRAIPDCHLFGYQKTGHVVMMNMETVTKLKAKARLMPFLESAYIVRAFETPGEFSKLDRPSDAAFVELDILHREEDELQRNVELLDAILGETTFAFSSQYHRWDSRYLPSKNALSVLRAFAVDALAPITAMAKKTSLSEKTVSTHLKELSAHNAFIISPAYDYTKLGPLVMATGLLVEEAQRARIVEKVKEKLGESWLEENVGAQALVGVTFVADNFDEAQRLYRSIREEDELANAVLTLYPEYLDNQANAPYMKRV